MSNKDSATEDLIKETAKRVFFSEGRFHATTQEIADAAGVNRTLVNYYFRSRDALFQKVILEGQAEFRQKLDESINPAHTFKQKISHLIDVWMIHSKKYPYLDAYLASQMNNSEMIEDMMKKQPQDEKKKKEFFAELVAEMKAGNIPTMDPMQFMLNMISLVSYPVTMRPLLEKALQMNKKSYNTLMAERKEAILKSLFIR